MLVLSRFAIDHPRRIVLLAMLATLVSAPGIARLRLRTDGHALVPADAPEVRQDRAIRKEFGLTDSIIVLLRHDAVGGIYNAQTLRRVSELTQRLQTLDGLKLTDVFSLATEKSHRVRPGTLHFLTLLDPLPQSPTELSTLRDDINKIKLYNGTLVSADEKATAIYIKVPNDADRLAFYSRIRSVLDGLDPITPDEIHITGAPVAESLLGTHILEDLGVPVRLLGHDFTGRAEKLRGLPKNIGDLRLWIAGHVGLLPVAIAVMTLVFIVAFRSFTAAAFTWFKTVCCLTIVFGLMGWCGVPIYLTTAVIPVILTATGVSDEVHIFGRYARNLVQLGPSSLHHESFDARTTARTAMLAAMTEVWRPVTMTSVTTAIGFLSFALSPLAPVRAFGLFTALGSMICMGWALTATPALAVMVHPRRFDGGTSRRGAENAEKMDRMHKMNKSNPNPVHPVNPVHFSTAMLAAFGRTLMARRHLVLVLYAGLLVAAVFGIRRIEIQDSWIDGFSPASRFYQSTQLFNDQFLGMHVLFVCVDTGNQKFTGTLDQRDVDHLSVKLPGDLVPNPAVLPTQWIELRRMTPASASPREASLYPYQSLIVSAVREGDRMAVGLERPKGSPRFRLQLKTGDAVKYTISSRRLAFPETLRVIREFEHFLAAHSDEKVGGALGPAAYLETTNYIALGRREEARAIPDDVDRIVYLWNWYGNIRGSDRLRATVDPDLSRAIINIYMKNANFRDTERLLEDVQRYQREKLAAHNISVSFAGDVAVSQTLIRAIVSTEVRSVSFSLLGVLVVCILLSRSLKWGLIAVLPCALAVPLNFALMGWLGIPLGVATSMFTAMTIGVGVDYAIHFVERYRQSVGAGASTSQGVIETFTAAGPSILIDALSVALGFSVLTLSQVPANARLGLMVLASIATCLAATLLLLPAVLEAVSRKP